RGALTELPHGVRVHGREREPHLRRGGLAGGGNVGAEDDARPHPRALAELRRVAVLPDPVLLPLPDGGVVRVEALAVAAVPTGPVLEQRTSAAHGLNAARAGGTAARRSRDGPLTDPEVESVSFRDVRARCRRAL